MLFSGSAAIGNGAHEKRIGVETMLSRRTFLQRIGVGAAAAGLGPLAWGGGRKKRPNVILILTDDQGYGDMSCHGNPILKTWLIDPDGKSRGAYYVKVERLIHQ